MLLRRVDGAYAAVDRDGDVVWRTMDDGPGVLLFQSPASAADAALRLGLDGLDVEVVDVAALARRRYGAPWWDEP